MAEDHGTTLEHRSDEVPEETTKSSADASHQLVASPSGPEAPRPGSEASPEAGEIVQESQPDVPKHKPGAKVGNANAQSCVTKYFAKPVWALSVDSVVIEDRNKYVLVMAVANRLAKAMGKLKAPKDMDKKAEGNRRVASMRSKMNTYKNANRRYGRAAHVDQAMAEQNDLLEAESGLRADEQKLMMRA